MAPVVIQDVFENDEKDFPTQTWYSNLAANANIYENCYVERITHVKNLRSEVLHEYIQVIVVDAASDTRTRLITERQVEGDRVIVGRSGWSFSSSLSSSSGFFSFVGRLFSLSSSSISNSNDVNDLPLPLYSLTFKAKSFNIVDLARLLSVVSEMGGYYNALSTNCYWYATKMYKLAKRSFQVIEEKEWKFKDWRGSIPKIVFGSRSEAEVSYCIHIRRMTRTNETNSEQPEARDFGVNRQNTMQYLLGVPPLHLLLAEAYTSIALCFLEDNNIATDEPRLSRDQVGELRALIKNDIEKKATESVLEKASTLEPKCLAFVPNHQPSHSQLHESIAQFVELETKKENDANAEKYIDVYKSSLSGAPPQVWNIPSQPQGSRALFANPTTLQVKTEKPVDIDGIELYEKPEEESVALERAMEISVGRVISHLQEQTW
ncbi:hypothetical protein BO78DRAFT_382704 [Aspergillus sclerotiicarbonarius CBS 121057]|uniref:Uncharacterized protein n=1 Tax=Aspergillus sclerotiicarbonarius (strain CBS 121057 / IBT 28362) TaxID=1448318 RepID=A0A319EUQ0_ASPSB|nr:hypothetical protein BO78DRAFT_382704 [Aspergillus sclerotiicarbonarius CBS 121057]